MTVKIGFVIDPIAGLEVTHDSSIAMIRAAWLQGWQVFVCEVSDLFIEDAKAFATITEVIPGKQSSWYELKVINTVELASLNVIMMRKDPPFDLEYIYATYMLEMAEQKGALVVNKPQSLRDANEKMFINNFPNCITDTVVTRSATQIKQFLQKHKDIILKPLDGMGGSSIFRVKLGDGNLSVIIETMTALGQKFIMLQKYLPEIKSGDKRIILIDGKPQDYAFARLAKSGEVRANIAAGGTGVAVKLTERDYWLCRQIAPVLKSKGLIFVGLDVIGDYITEINVTSPTCAQELNNAITGLDVAGDLIRCLEEKLNC